MLATNYSAYTLEITRSKVPDLEATIEELSQLVEVTRDRRKFKRLMDDSKRFESIPLRSRLSDEEVARFTAQRWRFPGVDIKARFFRNYPLEDVAGHVVGYIGRINQREQEALEDSDDYANYRGTEVIGKLGIEQSYEKQLHGTTGCGAAGNHSRWLCGAPPQQPPRHARGHRGAEPGCRACKSWWKTCTASAVVRWWPWTRATAKCWPW